VIVSIPTKAVTDLPRGLLANVHASVVVVDTGNYHPELRDGRIDPIDDGMLDSEWVAQQLGRPVIKAFNNILANSLLEKGMPAGAMGRIALSVAGDPADARTIVLRLVDDLGFDPIDGGGLDDSWRQQPGTPASPQRSASRRRCRSRARSLASQCRAGAEPRPPLRHAPSQRSRPTGAADPIRRPDPHVEERATKRLASRRSQLMPRDPLLPGTRDHRGGSAPLKAARRIRADPVHARPPDNADRAWTP
jgi:predicted dinucleotide-binding enzyme